SRLSRLWSPTKRRRDLRAKETQPCPRGVAATTFAFPRKSLRSGQSQPPAGRSLEPSLEIFFSPPQLHT
ncbi:hypothetical protein, partial [Brevibacillus formosus]|uniref:hypothetical protein n=1 Tax=Brevibacillus formosus TaxID=54913 RepID=UPI003D1AD944